MIDILVNGEYLDVRKGEEKRFFITKSIQDLRDLESRDSTRTNTVTLPRSARNELLLGGMAPNVEPVYTAQDCEVRLSGVTVLQDAKLVVTSVNQTEIRVFIAAGAAGFYNRLSTEPLKEISTEDINFDWTFSNVTAASKSSAGVAVPVHFVTTNKDYQQFIDASGDPDALDSLRDPDVNRLGFVIYAKYLVDKITQGLPVDLSALEALDDYNRLGIACPMTQIFDAAASLGSLGRVEFLDTVLLEKTTARPPFDNVVTNIGSIWDDVNLEFTFSEGGTFNLALSLAFFIQTTGLIYFSIWQTRSGSGSLLRSWSVNCLNYEIYHTAQSFPVTVQPGDVVFVQYSSPAKGSFYNSALTQGGQFVRSYFQMQSQNTDSIAINFADWLPELSQRDFVRAVFNCFHAIVNDENGLFVVDLFDKIRTQPEQNLEANIDQKRAINESPIVSNYAQVNIFRMMPSERVPIETFNAAIQTQNTSLSAELVKIELPFAGMDSPFHDVAGDILPVYDVFYRREDNNKMNYSKPGGATYITYSTQNANELTAGSIVIVDNIRFYVRQTFDNKSGEFTDTGTASGNDQDWTHLNYELAAADFALCFVRDQSASVRFFGNNGFTVIPEPKYCESVNFNYLIDNYYKTLENMMIRPLITQVWCELRVLEYLVLTPTRPIYYEADRWYLNKAEQYKANGLVRLELIRL